MDNRDLKISISGGILNFEDYIGLSQAGQIMAFLGTQSYSPQSQNSSAKQMPAQIGLQTNTVKLSPREFLDDCQARSYPQIILALGKYFLTHRSSAGEQHFSTKEIQVLMREAKEPPSTNLSRDFGRAAEAGWISDETKGKYWITTTGEKALDSKFEEPRKAGTRNSRPGAAPTSALRAEVETLEIVAEMENLPEYWAFGSEKREKILWILAAAKKLGINGLTGAEVNFIATKKLTDEPFSSVNMLAKSLQKDSLAINEKGTYRILGKGEKLMQGIKSELLPSHE